ncbi:MAG: YbaB/EbfC family nucleoid-associated protein [Vampirovibrionia bacterium]
MKGFNLQKMLKQAQRMQSAMTDAQSELSDVIVEGHSGGGLVSVKYNGKGEFMSIKVKPEALNSENPESVTDEDIETIEDLITSAIKDASVKANELAQEKMSSITGGMELNLPPGLF